MTRLLPRRTAVALVATLLVTAVASAQRSASTIGTDRIFEALGLEAGQTVCEMGAGDGDLSIAAARIVGPSGRIYTNELGADRLEALQDKVAGSGLAHITVVEGAAGSTRFPEQACDALFMRNVYHHFEDPVAMNASIAASLKSGGRVAVVDFSPPDKEAGLASDRDTGNTHGVLAETVSRELAAAGFEQLSVEHGDGRWFMVVLAKP